MSDSTSPLPDRNNAREGFTVWLTPHIVGSTARAGLVRNADGTTAVAIDARKSFSSGSAGIFADLLKHLDQVADLGHSLNALSPPPTGVDASLVNERDRDTSRDKEAVMRGPVIDSGNKRLRVAVHDIPKKSADVVESLPVNLVGGSVVDDGRQDSAPSVDGTSTATVGEGGIAGVEHADHAADARPIDVTPEVLEAVAEFLFDTGVETPMINNLRSIAGCLRVDLDDPVDVAPTAADLTLDELGKKLADALEDESERKLVFHSAQRTQVIAAKRLEDASSAVLEIEKQIRRHVTGEQS